MGPSKDAPLLEEERRGQQLASLLKQHWPPLKEADIVSLLEPKYDKHWCQEDEKKLDAKRLSHNGHIAILAADYTKSNTSAVMLWRVFPRLYLKLPTDLFCPANKIQFDTSATFGVDNIMWSKGFCEELAAFSSNPFWTWDAKVDFRLMAQLIQLAVRCRTNDCREWRTANHAADEFVQFVIEVLDEKKDSAWTMKMVMDGALERYKDHHKVQYARLRPSEMRRLFQVIVDKAFQSQAPKITGDYPEEGEIYKVTAKDLELLNKVLAEFSPSLVREGLEERSHGSNWKRIMTHARGKKAQSDAVPHKTEDISKVISLSLISWERRVKIAKRKKKDANHKYAHPPGVSTSQSNGMVWGQGRPFVSDDDDDEEEEEEDSDDEAGSALKKKSKGNSKGKAKPKPKPQTKPKPKTKAKAQANVKGKGKNVKGKGKQYESSEDSDEDEEEEHQVHEEESDEVDEKEALFKEFLKFQSQMQDSKKKTQSKPKSHAAGRKLKEPNAEDSNEEEEDNGDVDPEPSSTSVRDRSAAKANRRSLLNKSDRSKELNKKPKPVVIESDASGNESNFDSDDSHLDTIGAIAKRQAGKNSTSKSSGAASQPSTVNPGASGASNNMLEDDNAGFFPTQDDEEFVDPPTPGLFKTLPHLGSARVVPGGSSEASGQPLLDLFNEAGADQEPNSTYNQASFELGIGASTSKSPEVPPTSPMRSESDANPQTGPETGTNAPVPAPPQGDAKATASTPLRKRSRDSASSSNQPDDSDDDSRPRKTTRGKL